MTYRPDDNLQPILPLVEERFGIAADALKPYGHYKAKVVPDALPARSGKPASSCW